MQRVFLFAGIALSTAGRQGPVIRCQRTHRRLHICCSNWKLSCANRAAWLGAPWTPDFEAPRLRFARARESLRHGFQAWPTHSRNGVGFCPCHIGRFEGFSKTGWSSFLSCRFDCPVKANLVATFADAAAGVHAGQMIDVGRFEGTLSALQPTSTENRSRYGCRRGWWSVPDERR
jgi:hypothetical protein